MIYEIFIEGSDRVEAEISGFDANDALMTFADQMERLDVPAFYFQDDSGAPYIEAAGDHYRVREATSRV